jgi:hypothetical protein
MLQSSNARDNLESEHVEHTAFSSACSSKGGGAGTASFIIAALPPPCTDPERAHTDNILAARSPGRQSDEPGARLAARCPLVIPRVASLVGD